MALSRNAQRPVPLIHSFKDSFMPSTKNTLAAPIRKKAIALLNARLADALDLHTQSKQAHWNVKGPSFIALHELFDKIAEETDGYVDDIAERITALGGIAEGTARVAAKKSSLKEYPLDITKGSDHVEALSNALAEFGTLVREAIDAASGFGDADTADLFTGISRGVDKYLWFVESHNL
jgi:starvation-inducible DNA-binding protein